jgi:hypothetical protein
MIGIPCLLGAAAMRTGAQAAGGEGGLATRQRPGAEDCRAVLDEDGAGGAVPVTVAVSSTLSPNCGLGLELVSVVVVAETALTVIFSKVWELALAGSLAVMRMLSVPASPAAGMPLKVGSRG